MREEPLPISTMFNTSPTKRRRTKGTFATSPKKNILSTSTMPTIATPPRAAPPWPTNQLPVELFTLICTFLPRSTIQNMRLVNKEFERKISEYLFRVVVVPFRPEIYGIAPEPSLPGALVDGANDMVQGSVMLQDKGMRVFQGYGGRISKFAMSFEFDEKKLANPPSKSDQEAITSFWGIYRWPFKNYNRYSQLEGLEQTADETRTMAKALRYITSAKELGLSIDGGLGWISGPDINHKVEQRGNALKVFGASTFVSEPKLKPIIQVGKLLGLDFLSNTLGRDQALRALLTRVISQAGHEGDVLEDSVQLLVESEDLLIGDLSGNELLQSLEVDNEGLANLMRGIEALSAIPETSFVTEANGTLSPLTTSVADDDEETDILLTDVSIKGKVKNEAHALKPRDLSNAQREMLLELEWAQRAFMQSYAIAILDNPTTFNRIEALTIARLPNRHLPILRRTDFWNSLPQLTKFSLAIIPDWREVTKLPTSYVQDVKLAPSLSISGVYQILHEQIAPRRNIKSFHFEWLCGGEDAPGLFARNQHILAAPLVYKAMDMLDRTELPSVLSLPHIAELSLKNCWISPHIFTRFGLLHRNSLKSLILDSVSLTAPVPLNAHPNPLPVHGAHAQNFHHLGAQNAAAAVHLFWNAQGLAPGQNAQAPPAQPVQPVLPNDGADPTTNNDWLYPRAGSWASIIETLTPAGTLAQQRYLRSGSDFDIPPTRNNISLENLTFRSCGYVRLPMDFDQTTLNPHGPPPLARPTVADKRSSDLDKFMMKPNDHALGVIVNHIDANEVRALEDGFFLRVGWNMSNPVVAEMASDATIDGVTYPGQGRFRGTIKKDLTTSTTST